MIRTVAQLNDVRNRPARNVRLGTTIRLFGFDWQPIPRFTGFFDGRGYSIQGIHVAIATNTTRFNYGGLFHELEGNG